MEKIVKPDVKHIAPYGGYFQITNVLYRGETNTYMLFDTLTSNMTQDELTEFYNKEKQKGNPHPIDSALHFSLIDAAVRSKNTELINSINDKLRSYPNTMSRAFYNSSGDDELIHNYGTKDAYSLKGSFSGIDSSIKDIKDKKILESFLGKDDPEFIDRVSNFGNNLIHLKTLPKVLVSHISRGCILYFLPNISFPYNIDLIAGETHLSDKNRAFRVLQVN